ncbi:MAG: hypothetical protein J0L93_07625 [Deltaproteobacteria bacterium]|nr:hypothetical protein [Deltaproteobacteria bacterium]
MKIKLISVLAFFFITGTVIYSQALQLEFGQMPIFTCYYTNINGDYLNVHIQTAPKNTDPFPELNQDPNAPKNLFVAWFSGREAGKVLLPESKYAKAAWFPVPAEDEGVSKKFTRISYSGSDFSLVIIDDFLVRPKISQFFAKDEIGKFKPIEDLGVPPPAIKPGQTLRDLKLGSLNRKGKQTVQVYCSR